jgi:hypothetical protein
VTATRLASSSSSGTGLPTGWKGLKSDFAAVGNGVADDTTPIQNALDALKAGTCELLYVEPGTYNHGDVTMDNSGGWKIMGANPCNQYQSGSSRFKYTGLGGGSLSAGWAITRSSGWEIENIAWDYSNALFTGHLVNVDGTGADCQDFHIHHCGSRANTANTAESIIRMHKCVIGYLDHSHFTGANHTIRLGDDGGSYVNVVTIGQSTFNFARAGHIHFGSADGEAVVIRECSFEAGTSTPGITGATGSRFYKPTIDACWFGDASAAVNWIDGIICQSNSYVGTISNNFFYDPIGGTDMKLGGGDWWVHGNAAQGGVVFDVTANTGNTHITSIANSWIGGTLWKSGTVSADYRSLGSNNGLNAPDVLPRTPRTVATFSGFSPNTLTLGNGEQICQFQRGGGGVEVGIPTNATAAFPIGTEIILYQEASSSAGTVTFVPAGGVTLQPAVTVLNSHGTATLRKMATNVWSVEGQVT